MSLIIQYFWEINNLFDLVGNGIAINIFNNILHRISQPVKFAWKAKIRWAKKYSN